MATTPSPVSYAWPSWLLGLTAFLLSGSMLNHGLVDSVRPEGPGLTLDESFNIEQGVYLTEALGHHGPLIFSPSAAREVFGHSHYLPDHPPLGRLLLGLTHETTAWCLRGTDDSVFHVPAARLGSCLAFALTVLLLSEFARRQFNQLTGVFTGLLLIGTPHLMGHSRIAALETVTNLAWVVSILPLLAWWTRSAPPTHFQAMVSGLCWGLLLLTKMQGLFIPPVIVLWSVWQFRRQSVRPLLLWGICGILLFYGGWPWLWLEPSPDNPVPHVLQYLGRTTSRSLLYCWYFGERFSDRQVPWHYPFVMCLITLPVWSVIGVALRLYSVGFPITPFRTLVNTLRRQSFTVPEVVPGTISHNSPTSDSSTRKHTARDQADHHRVEWLLLILVLFPPIVFSVPGVPVYDGTRLFLMFLLPLSVLAARGIALFCQGDLAGAKSDPAKVVSSNHRTSSVGHQFHWKTSLLCLLMFVTPLWWTMSPFATAAYGPLCLGNRGAARLGMEAGYWSEALNGSFWNQVPIGTTLYVAPVSHQFQLSAIQALVPVVSHRQLTLLPWKYDPVAEPGPLLLIHRLADLRPELATPPEGARVVVEVRHDGVIFARIVEP